jgi:hypothetical protein
MNTFVSLAIIIAMLTAAIVFSIRRNKREMTAIQEAARANQRAG